ncbi:MAG: hypothetical protein ACREMY_24610 [bacterium]
MVPVTALHRPGWRIDRDLETTFTDACAISERVVLWPGGGGLFRR